MTFIILEDDLAIINEFEELSNTRDDIELIGTTNSSFDAIKLVKKLKPEAIIIDLELPNGFGTGFEFLIELRNTKLDFIPLVVVNTKVQPGMIYDGIHEGYADLVFYKAQADYKLEYVINSMVFSRRKENVIAPTTNTLKDIEAKKTIDLLNKELDLVGISHKHTGREYIFQAILLMLENSPKTPREISPLPSLAKLHNTYASNITREINTAINYAWLNTDIDTLEKHYTAPLPKETCMPTPMELIYFYYKKIKSLI
jgi:DNA-binding NarL/FixJ family response regulator